MPTLQMTFRQTDVSTKRDTQSITANAYKPWSVLGDLALDRRPRPGNFATLEPNYTLLDGSFDEFPDTPYGTFGFWSEQMSGADSSYPSPPTLRFTFSIPHRSRGISFFYYGDCGYTVRVTWYSDIEGTDIILSGEYETQPELGVVREAVNGYRCIDVEFLRSSIPFRFVKWWAVEYGLIRIVLDPELNWVGITEEIDPTSESISRNRLRANIRSRNSFISPITSPDFDDMLMEQQMLEIVRDGLPFGTFFLESWEDPYQSGISFDISAEDAMMVLDLYPHMGDMYIDEPVQNLLDEIFLKCFPTGIITYILDPSFENSTITGWIPIGTCGLAFQHIAFALNATVNAARIGDIRIYPREVEAKLDSAPTSDNKQPWVDMDDLKSYEPPHYLPSLEPNYTLLDGGLEEFPDEKGNLIYGWQSLSMSDENGIFPPDVAMEVSYETSHNLTEFIIDCGAYENEFIRKLRLTLFDENNEIIHSQEYEFTANPLRITDRVYGYRRLRLEALESSAPFRFARIASINYGRSFYIPLTRQLRERGRDRPTDYITGVRVVSHRYTPSNDEMEVFNAVLPVGLETIQFPEPLHSPSITGGTITELGANYAVVNVTAQGLVILSGKRYIDNKQFHVVNAEIEAGRIEKVRLYENYTLISPDIGDERARELFEHLRLPVKTEKLIKLEDTEVGHVAQVQTQDVMNFARGVRVSGRDVVGVVQRLDITDLRADLAEMVVIGSVAGM